MSNQSKGRPGGVLPVNAAVTKKPNQSQKPAQRSPAPRLRLIIRRLPPGLLETEFWEAIGTEWQTSNGKVDWHAFKEGKVSKDPSKPSEPGRAYLRVKDQSYLELLSAKVKATTFRDAKNTINDSCLVGPPSLEFAPYNKVPSGRQRHDGRQGTIDQDQEFIDFLQSLTEPITKPATNGSETAELKSEKVVTTPLVQFIKEKKANKAKEKEAAAAAKSSKKNQEGKEGKTKGEPRPTIVVKSNAATVEKNRVTKAAQEAVKAANKPAAQIQTKTSAAKTEPKASKELPPPVVVASASPAAKSERQRGNVSAASRMIARDLGLAPKEPRTPRAARNASTSTPTTTESTSKADTPSKATVVATASPKPHVETPASTVATPAVASVSSPAASTPPTGPRSNRNSQTPQTKTTQATQQRHNKLAPQPTPGAKSAFLKHANPSQGVTEELLRTVFTEFGEVTKCEIDKKKGLGYIDFTDTDALKKAMAASPVKVGNGQVVILENRSPYQKRQGQSANVTQQQAGTSAPASKASVTTASPATSAVTSPQPATALMAAPDLTTITKAPTVMTASEVQNSAEPVDSSSAQTATPSTPTAPKGTRGGNTPGRGPRGASAANSARGGFSQNSNRGRGGFRGRGGRANRGGTNTATATAGASGPGATTSIPASSGDKGDTSDVAKSATVEKT